MNGSFHKSANKNLHNHDDLNYSRFLKIAIEISSLNSLSPDEWQIASFEFGVNIEVPFPPKIFIDNILLHGGVQPNKIRSSKRQSVEFKHNRYDLKIYDKSLQYGLGKNIIRYEIRITRMEHLKSLKIITVGDLLDLQKCVGLGKLLSKSWEDLLYTDKIEEISSLSHHERELYFKCSSEFFWVSNTLSSSTRFRYRRKFKSLVKAHGNSSFYKLHYLIMAKWFSLFNVNMSCLLKGDPNNCCYSDITSIFASKKYSKVIGIQTWHINNLYNVLIPIRKLTEVKQPKQYTRISRSAFLNVFLKPIMNSISN